MSTPFARAVAHFQWSALQYKIKIQYGLYLCLRESNRGNPRNIESRDWDCGIRALNLRHSDEELPSSKAKVMPMKQAGLS